MHSIQEMLRAHAAFTDDDVRFQNAYSGRGMVGRQCVGITGSWVMCMHVIGEVIKSARFELKDEEHNPDLNFDLVVDALLEFEKDSLGYGVILYWPELESIVD